MTNAEFFRGLRMVLAGLPGANPVDAAMAVLLRSAFVEPANAEAKDSSARKKDRDDAKKRAQYWEGIATELEGSKIFDIIAKSIINTLISSEVPGAADPEDELQNLAVWLLKGSTDERRLDTIRRSVRDIQSLKRVMNVAFYNQLISRFRYLNVHETSGITTGIGEEGEEVSIVDIMEGPSKHPTDQEGERALKAMKKQLMRYVRSRVTPAGQGESESQEQRVFDRYFKLLETKSPDKINFRKDVAGVLAKEDKEKLTNSVHQRWNKRWFNIKQYIVDFFMKALDPPYNIQKYVIDRILPVGERMQVLKHKWRGVDMDPDLPDRGSRTLAPKRRRSNTKKSSDEDVIVASLTDSWFKRAVAAWMLGAVV